MASDSDYADTIAAAHVLLGDADAVRAAAELGELLDDDSSLLALPVDPPEHAMRCVDGAVASEHADALVWIAAVATDSAHETLRTKTAVAPVSSSIDAFKSAVMALCEMSIAREVCDNHGEAWMDGGLVTPLLSLVTGLLIDDPETSGQLCSICSDVDAVGIVDDYLHFALTGALSALPKQDTATTFAGQWRGLDGITTPTATWLARQRDRTVAGMVLPPGHYLAPRRGIEALRVEAKTPNRGDRRAAAWAARIDTLLEQWREEVQPWVTYVAPTDDSTHRATKVEFTTTSDDERDATAALRCAQANNGIAGGRVLEPLEQYMVDRHAKSEVQGLLAGLMAEATSSFADDPAAVRSYRT